MFIYSLDGHFNRDFLRGLGPICSHYNQVGQKKTDCPRLTSGAVGAVAPSSLRITDAHKGMDEAPTVRGRAFQLQTVENRAPPGVEECNVFIFPMLLFCT